MRRNKADVLTHGDSNGTVFLVEDLGVRGLWLVGRRHVIGAHNFRMCGGS